MLSITSSQNPLLKELKALRARKYREEKGLYTIEGIRFVEEALKEQAPIKKVIVSEKLETVNGGKALLLKLQTLGIDAVMLPDKLFAEVSDTENPQGVMAMVGMEEKPLDVILYKSDFIVVLDSVQDPGNMGTIIRTADAAGAGGVVLSSGCVDVYNPKALRSTMGSVFHIPVCRNSSLPELTTQLKQQGFKVCASHLQGTVPYYELSKPGKIAIIIGNEANGISDESAELADMLVRIPMPGRAESLNASVAAALLMYEVVRSHPVILTE